MDDGHAEPALYLVKTLAVCSDEEGGARRLVEYVEGVLPLEEAEAFENHLARCQACLADLSNAANIAASLKAGAEDDQKPRILSQGA